MQFKDHFKASLINECTSVGISVGGKLILAKNRDRTYYPTVKIIRDMINGIEVAYMYDEDTDYSEGLNELGIGIVNTTLQGKRDENEGSSDKNPKSRHKKLSADGNKIRKALGYSDIKEIVKSLDLYDRGLGGHTTVGYSGGFISIEKLKFGKPGITQFDKNGVVVRTNHGIKYPDQGYQYGKDRESSLSRQFLATKEARLAKTPEDVLKNLRTHHFDVPSYLEPYRTNYKVWTSSQILLNLTDLEMIFVVDENANFLGIEDRLPRDYKPKINIKIEKLETKFVTRDANYKGDERQNPEDKAKNSDKKDSSEEE